MNIVIIGATSFVAIDVARIYALKGADILLIARNAAKLNEVKNDLLARGAANVDWHLQDLEDISSYPELTQKITSHFLTIDILLIAHGLLINQEMAKNDWNKTHQSLVVNYLSPVAFLTYLQPFYEKQRTGTIAVISSVAGDRGRRTNYTYGSAKAGLTNFLSGYRSLMQQYNVHVITVKPGFIDTPMTAHIPKTPLFAESSDIASGIANAIEKKRNIVYLPKFWRIIMTIIVHIPEIIFKKLNI